MSNKEIEDILNHRIKAYKAYSILYKKRYNFNIKNYFTEHLFTLVISDFIVKHNSSEYGITHNIYYALTCLNILTRLQDPDFLGMLCIHTNKVRGYEAVPMEVIDEIANLKYKNHVAKTIQT